MHIAFVFSEHAITDKELRLLREVRAGTGVSRVSVKRVFVRDSVARGLERFRASVERKVARFIIAEHAWETVANEFGSVELCADLPAAIQSSGADRVVNFTGLPYSSNGIPIFELRYNRTTVVGLGEGQAHCDSPGLVEVVARTGQHAGVVQQSVLTPTAATPSANRQNAASRATALLLRALAMPDDALRARAHVELLNTETHSTMGRTLHALSATVRVVVAAVVRRTMREVAHDDAWELQYRTNSSHFVANSSTINAAGFKPYRGGFDRFVADCVAVTHHGVTAVFFEEYHYATRRGVISCAVLGADGTLGPPQRVLERDYHLSYPFVFRDGERLYMVPESSGNRTVDLYECEQFPLQWSYRKTLLDGISATDATFHHDGERWWMFATVGEYGAYGWDELHIYHATTLEDAWTAHPANPVKCDPASARPAGPLFRRAGRLIRPTQDCSVSYGGAVNLCAIDVLTTTEFREQVVDRLDPSLIPGMNGLHTLTSAEGIEVIDVRPVRRMRWEPATLGRRGRTPSNFPS